MRIGHDLPGCLPLGAALADNSFGREVRTTRMTRCWRCRSPAVVRARRHSLLASCPSSIARAADRATRGRMIDCVDFVSGVSGGSVTAAYYGLKKRAALDDFRERSCCATPRKASDRCVARSYRPRVRRRRQRQPVYALARRQPVRGREFEAFREGGGRGSGSTPPTSTTARPSCSARPPSTRMCSDIRPIRWRMRWRRRRRCRVAFAPMVHPDLSGRLRDTITGLDLNARDNPNAPPLLKSFAEANAPLPRRLDALRETARRRPR